MASENVVEEDYFLKQVEMVRDKVRKKFKECQKALDSREEELIKELNQLKASYECQDIVKEMDRLKKKSASTTAGDNLNVKRMRELKSDLDSTRGRLREVKLEWDENLQGSLQKIGSLCVVAVPDYKSKVKPVFGACKHSYETSSADAVFKYPRSIAIDRYTNNIFICDSGNDRVQVFDEFLNFLFKIGDRLKQPFGICVNQNNVYVTQSVANSLNVYSTNGNFIKTVGNKGKKELEFDSPRGVDVSNENNLICVCDWNNNRVQCLNLNLNFSSSISDINHPIDIKLTSQEIVVLIEADPCLIFYDYSGNSIRRIMACGDDQQFICFCLDIDSNVLMTDKLGGCVIIFSKTGELLCKFGKREEGEEGEGEFIQPIGIAVDYKGRIIVGSSKPKRCIQMF